VVKMNSCGSWRKLYSVILSDVEYWTWLNGNTIGLVTDQAVFHWVMEEGMVNCFNRKLKLERFRHNSKQYQL